MGIPPITAPAQPFKNPLDFLFKNDPHEGIKFVHAGPQEVRFFEDSRRSGKLAFKEAVAPPPLAGQKNSLPEVEAVVATKATAATPVRRVRNKH